MTLLLLALFIFLLAGLTALVAGSSARWSTIVGAGGAMIGSLIGLIPTISVLRGAPSPVVRLPWEVPYGSFFIALDALSAFFLLPLFVLLGREHGSLDFDGFSASAGSSVVFLLAVIGFGAKAGFMPLHVWLPEAHPAAPTHVSAVMSGVMIKTGIYGLVRILTFIGPPPMWWGWVLCGIGVTSGIFGVLFALAQHDLKRLLAYSSVENIGIIALGLGVGFIGLSSGSSTLAVLGFAGGLLHVLNHALFKGLLFLGT